MKIGDRVFVRGYIDEIRKDTVIIRNAGGYFGTIPSEVITGALPPAQPDPNCSEIPNNSDTISRQAAIDALEKWESESTWDEWCYDHKDEAEKYSVISPSSVVFDLPSAQPEPAIPLQWIEAQIEWLKSLDNAFSTLTALQISAMVNKWKGEQDG